MKSANEAHDTSMVPEFSMSARKLPHFWRWRSCRSTGLRANAFLPRCPPNSQKIPAARLRTIWTAGLHGGGRSDRPLRAVTRLAPTHAWRYQLAGLSDAITSSPGSGILSLRCPKADVHMRPLQTRSMTFARVKLIAQPLGNSFGSRAHSASRCIIRPRHSKLA